MTFPGSHWAVAVGSLQASMQSVSYQNYSLATIIIFSERFRTGFCDRHHGLLLPRKRKESA